MTKKVKIIALLATLLVIFSLFGCSQAPQPTAIKTVVVYSEKLEKMVVIIPTIGTVVLPSDDAFDADGNAVKVQTGDVITMSFSDKIYVHRILQDSGESVYYYDTKPERIDIKMKNVEAKIDGIYYEFSFLKSQISGDVAVDKTLGFFAENQETPSYSSIITSFDGEKATIRIIVDDVNKLLNSLCNGEQLKIS